MRVLTLSTTWMSCLIALQLPKAYETSLKEVFAARLEAASSQDPCPALQTKTHCQWTVWGRAGGLWQRCDGEHPPSGARHLAAHRWFLLKPQCRMAHLIPLFIPPQIVYR